MQLYTNAKQLHTANANECEDSGMTFATITSETTTRNANLQLTSGKMPKSLVMYLLDINQKCNPFSNITF